VSPLNLPTKFYLTDRSNDSKIKEHKIGIINEISRPEVPISDVINSYSNQLSVYAMIEVVSTKSLRTVRLIFPLMIGCIDLRFRDHHRIFAPLWLFNGVINWAVAKMSL
jgi:hypothetical protein